MKNTLLWSTLFTLIGTQVHAELTQQTPPTPVKPQQTAPSAQPSQAPTQVINCEYKISPETKKIDQSLVVTWAEKAVTQAFDFEPNQLDEQLQKLQPCFTEQGWTGFNTALQKSGNLEAIKSQKLTVSSQVDGQVVVTEAKDNQWKLNLPLQVVYQNEKEKVTQPLSVDVTIGRKVTGDLGIMQMIAVPKAPAATQEKSANMTNGATTTNGNTENPTNTPTPETAPTAPQTPATTPTQPTLPENRVNQPSPNPATPGQPTLPENRSNQPSLPENSTGAP